MGLWAKSDFTKIHNVPYIAFSGPLLPIFKNGFIIVASSSYTKFETVWEGIRAVLELERA